jgi:anti-sigma regulatory factor (Ser/Thr protein kinase)
MVMSENHGRLRHSAYIYEATDAFVSNATAFLRAGLEKDEGGIVLNTRPGLSALRESLGPDAQHVLFIDNSSAFTRPAKALAFYNRVYADGLAKHASVRVISQSQPGPDPSESKQWMGFESVINDSFRHLPAWVLCSYNANAAPDATLENVWRTHPEVMTGDGFKTSDQFEDPVAVLRRITPQPAVLDGLRSIRFGDIENFRETLARELVAENVPQAKIVEMLLAATELAANAIEHGGGVKDVRVGSVDGRFVCEIVDAGAGFDDPTAGYLAPHADRGTGLWVARQLAWDVEFLRSPDGFTARIWL